MKTNIQKLCELIEQLRDEKSGCPWTKDQTLDSIVPYTIEEAYEVAEVIANKDYDSLKDELGDLLLQVVFYGQIAKESNLFDFEDIAQASLEKQIKRNAKLEKENKTAEQINAQWQADKIKERKNKQTSILDDIPSNLPAITRGLKLQERAAQVGFDWPEIQPVFEKVLEEIDELKKEMDLDNNQNRIKEELGDLFFSCINLARHLKYDPESILRDANRKFETRFKSIEKQTSQENKNLSDLTLEEMDSLWEKTK